MWQTTLKIRGVDGICRMEQHINAAEARRSLVRHVRRNNWRIEGTGQRGVVRERALGNSPIMATYEID